MNDKISDIASRLQAIIDTAIDGIITIDDRGFVEAINQAGCTLFGYQAEEIIGSKINMLMPIPDKSNHDQYLARYQKTREPKIIGLGREVTGQRKDGSLFPFRLAVSEVNLNNRIIYTGIIHDLTEVKEAKQKLLRSNEELESKVLSRTNQLETVVNSLLETNKELEENRAELKFSLQKEKELNELKTRFLSMASHEFRTPLSTIHSSASLISKYHLAEQQPKRGKHISRIKSSVDHLIEILNDFLTLGKFGENKIPLNKVNFDLSSFVKGIIDEIEGLLKQGQKIEVITSHNQVVNSDKNILQNILFNLLSNAIKFSPAGGLIEVNISAQDHIFSLEVKDYGIGIPESDQKYLAGRFFRASNSSNIQGTGLGLNIVSEYLNLLHGEMSISSEENVGTSVLLKIPNT